MHAAKTKTPNSRLILIMAEVLPVVGTIGLLGLWLYQQTGIEKRSNELSKIIAAHNMYQNYQANNAIFNAIVELVKDSNSIKAIRLIQDRNYELGLYPIEQVLLDSEKAGIPEMPDPYAGLDEVDNNFKITQLRLTALQDKTQKKEERLERESDLAKEKFFWWYIVLSLMSILGAIFSVVFKLKGK